ncbi:hypothetical protein ASZ78_012625 [Callipepla squamata]|uniref:SRCR domain-containing protein n=1 Tax=Callipepla squamata TaxID=9009 RepID=A0A226MWN3_CALSU|nr:hypothetical protein ASZ78_012625 [Callipepla squamata]
MMVPAGVLGLLLCVQICGGSEELRLVDGGGRCAGRVEVKHEGEWGSVCAYDFDWDMRGAGVVCQQLGCGTAAHTSPYAPFGQGLRNVPDAEALELRLVDGGGPCAGKVEVKLQGRWGTVVDRDWNMNDAEVVCQQLGCGSAAHTTFNRRVSQDRSPVMLALINCSGNEEAIWNCNVKGWGPYNTRFDYTTNVECQGFSRLAGGDSACSGRLEVRQGGAWVSVCHGHVDLMAAQVVCRELGCGAALAVPGPGHFGPSVGPFWDGAFECNGTELLLSACTQRRSHMQTCTHSAAIICSPYTEFRLVNGSSECVGRVEVEAQGVWGPLCATAWDLPDAHILCRHLGCGSAVSLHPPGHFGTGTGMLRHDALSCSGNERHPGECPVQVLGQPACPPGHTAAVSCSGDAEPLRLHGGESRCDGRLEVAVLPGVWARVSVGLWDNGTAAVACRQLGCGVPEQMDAVPANGSRPVELQELRCVGTEELLEQCNASRMATEPSRSPEQLAVTCSGLLDLRLSGGSSRCSGQLQVLHEGTWGRVCANGTSSATAAAVCRQLGCGTRGILEAVPAQGSEPAWLSWVSCEEGARSLWRCLSAPWQLQECSSTDITYITCDEVTRDRSEATSLVPALTLTAVPLTAAPRSVSVLTVLCVLLGTLLAMPWGRRGHRCHAHCLAGPSKDAASEAVYEELDYSLIPEYQEVPSRTGSLSQSSRTKLSDHTGNSAKECELLVSPESPAQPQHSPSHGYDDAVAALEVFPSTHTGDAPEQLPEDTGYDDVGVSTLGTSL